MNDDTPGVVTRELVEEMESVIRRYHAWLERVDQTPGGYFGLDHALGENVEGCSACAVLAGSILPGTWPNEYGPEEYER